MVPRATDAVIVALAECFPSILYSSEASNESTVFDSCK